MGDLELVLANTAVTGLGGARPDDAVQRDRSRDRHDTLASGAEVVPEHVETVRACVFDDLPDHPSYPPRVMCHNMTMRPSP